VTQIITADLGGLATTIYRAIQEYRIRAATVMPIAE